MKSIMIVIVGLISFTLIGLMVEQDGIPRRAANVLKTNTYMLTDGIQEMNRKGGGTGVWLDNQYMLTNCHVSQGFAKFTRNEDTQDLDIEYKPMYAIGPRGVKIFKMDTIACDEGKDLALLKARASNVHVLDLELDYRQPSFGARVYSAGYHYLMPLSAKIGIMGEIVVSRDNLRAAMTMPIAPGDSGSPIVDGRGKLIGLASAVRGERTYFGSVIPVADIALAIPAISINTFLFEEGYRRYGT